ncbi:helix-turn-helix transcriptional regulator [Infirmifilum sp. SLHALR2]|nr:MAG: hypothetical protein B7L53_06125 [Thermofilum sp. NZ13]
MPGKATALVPLLLLLILSLGALAQSLQGSEELRVQPGGIIEGRITATSPVADVLTISLPGQVQSLSVASSMEAVPFYNLSGSTLAMLLEPGEAVNVTFVSRISSGDPATIVVDSWNQSLVVRIHSSYVLLGVEPVPDSIEREGEYLVLRYSRLGEDFSLSFVELPPETQQPPSLGPGAPQTPVISGSLNPLTVAAAALVAAVAVGVTVYLARRGKRGGAVLTEDEEMIVEFLRSRGGKAYLSEIRSALGMPSTTALRRVRRLEEKGIVRTKRTSEGLLVALAR